MPDCCNGKRQTLYRTHQHGGHTSGRDFCFPDLSPSTTENPNPGKVIGARSCDLLPIRQAKAMAYKEAKHQSFVRIIASMLARVM